MMKLDFKSLLAGVPLNLGALSEDQIGLLALLSAHCILNGPVGVKKDTTFPTGKKGSINSLLGLTFSNSSWRATCRLIAEAMGKEGGLRDVISDSSQYRQHNNVWPLY